MGLPTSCILGLQSRHSLQHSLSYRKSSLSIAQIMFGGACCGKCRIGHCSAWHSLSTSVRGAARWRRYKHALFVPNEPASIKMTAQTGAGPCKRQFGRFRRRSRPYRLGARLHEARLLCEIIIFARRSGSISSVPNCGSASQFSLDQKYEAAAHHRSRTIVKHA